jgi:pyruvate/2-oxoglutarate dehydrogenase complex dihydrolipoamide dehydrogenase (E3) component
MSITSTRRATVVGGPQFSHYSGYQAVIAARNALFEACRMPMERVDRAVTKSDSSGFVQVVYRNDGTVVGVTVVAESAGEAIHEWILAVSNRLKMNDLASTIHVYRPYSIANQHPARRPARSSPF